MLQKLITNVLRSSQKTVYDAVRGNKRLSVIEDADVTFVAQKLDVLFLNKLKEKDIDEDWIRREIESLEKLKSTCMQATMREFYKGRIHELKRIKFKIFKQEE